MEKEKNANNSRIRISVLMGIYNCASTLVEALDSLYAQTYQGFKVILCDDGSTDDTYRVASDYASQHDNIILLRNERNMKLAATLNHCLQYADTEYVARMDGDDISLPERFEKEIAFLDEHPEYAIVSCPMIYFDEHGDYRSGKAIERPQRIHFAYGTPFCHAPCMIRTIAIKKVDGYTDTKFTVRMEDYYLWYKLYKAGFVGANLLEPLYKMRDDRNATIRRKRKDRLYGMKTDIEVLHGLGLPIRYWFRTLRNIPIMLMPSSIYNYFHQKKLNK